MIMTKTHLRIDTDHTFPFTIFVDSQVMFLIESTMPTKATNKKLAEIFSRMSDCYKYLGPSERFRAMAYEIASKTLHNLKEPVESFGHDIKKLDELKGIGTHIAEKILEYLDTGKIDSFEKLKSTLPYGLLSLMKLDGIGPATIRNLHNIFPVSTVSELRMMMKNAAPEKIEGVTAINLEKIKKELQLSSETKERIPFETAQLIANSLLEEIRNIPGVLKADCAGSIRRKKETIGDIDIVVSARKNEQQKIIKASCLLPSVSKVISEGTTKASMILKEKNIQADIRVVEEKQYGATLLYFTGSKEHNIALRKLARSKAWKLNEYGLFERETGRLLASSEEKDIYTRLGLAWIVPEKRTEKLN